jgi:hypothetical protein
MKKMRLKIRIEAETQNEEDGIERMHTEFYREFEDDVDGLLWWIGYTIGKQLTEVIEVVGDGGGGDASHCLSGIINGLPPSIEGERDPEP